MSNPNRTKVSVINKALSKLSAKRITSENEVNRRATESREAWEEILEETLGAFRWNFANRRQQLAQVTTTPAYDYDYAYRLPTDPRCVRVQGMDEGKAWVIEGDDSGGLLLTNYSTCYIRYTAFVNNPALWSGLFTNAFSTRLAAELCLAITNNRTLKETLLVEYDAYLDMAGVSDAQEAGDEYADDTRYPEEYDWIRARHGDSNRVLGDV